MSVEIRVPQLGESVVEATVARWLKQEGEPVEAGDAVVELETEKVNVEVPADGAGVLTKIAQGEGATVRVGDVLGVLDGQAQGQAAAPPQAAPASAPEAPPVVPAAAPAPEQAPAAPAAPGAPEEAAHVTPVARRLAEEHGIDASRVSGSGPGGRVMKEDVLGYIGRDAPAVAPDLAPAPAAPVPAPASRLDAPP
ncbi:MAG TPA: biotin/lipoyl-containing protein, partial [Chloroflexota bacterium]|nr:biotin/lipoyl-containing protein [Chloroflexota bacterium]